MTLPNECLLGYSLPGPWETLIVLAIVILLFCGRWRSLSDSLEEALRRDRRLRNRWFLHARESEERASRIATFAIGLMFWGALWGLAIILTILLHRALH